MIRVQNLSFTYPASTFRLDIADLSIDAGERVAVIGPSGSGKTTLLNLLAGVSLPANGHVFVGDVEISALSDAARRTFRLEQIGMVFQTFELLDYLSVLDNILLPLRIGGRGRLTLKHKERARTLAGFVGIGDKLDRHPQQLSQGERQRVAVSRALLLEPGLLLADEPTGNLDPDNKHIVLELLQSYATEQGATLITVTHDQSFLASFDRVVDFATLNEVHAA
jgi:putative ABC transport system ATP-binding protein